MIIAAPNLVNLRSSLSLPPDNWFFKTKMFVSSIRLGNTAEVSVGNEITDFEVPNSAIG